MLRNSTGYLILAPMPPTLAAQQKTKFGFKSRKYSKVLSRFVRSTSEEEIPTGDSPISANFRMTAEPAKPLLPATNTLMRKV